MKNLFLFLSLLSITTLTKAQSISPDPTSEMCPNQEYNFTATLPGNYNSISSSGGAIITSFPTGSGTSITFKGKFSDISGPQIFTVYYSGGDKSFTFTKVKSFYSGYKGNSSNPSTITIPICETTPKLLSLSGKYWNTSTNPYSTFGSITKFEYQIPAGWYLNATLSTGNNWIQADGSVTLTPDANTGNGSIIKYKAIGDCSNSITGDIGYISISRPNPTFSISPTSLAIVCGTTPTQTFTVSTSNTISCSISYSWNLGSNNGWLYNGNSAPATITTSTPSITLTSANGNILPSSIIVTPILNGISQTQLKSTTSLTPFTSSATISGSTSFCTLESSSIYTINAGAGNTVTWSSSNSQIASVSSGTNSQVTVTAHSQGLFYVNALITNPCGQTVPKSTVYPITVGAPMPLIDGFTCVSESVPCNLDIEANNNYLTFSLSAPSGTYVPQDSDWQWEKVFGNFYFLDNGQYNSSTHTGRQGNIYLTGVNPTDNPLQFRCRFKNTCGWGQWRNYVWNDGTTTPINPPPPPANYYTVVPNPTGGYSANITLLDPTIIPTTTTPIIVKLYTIFGQELSSAQLYNNSGMIYIYSFPYNTMYITITFDNHLETHTIVKY